MLILRLLPVVFTLLFILLQENDIKITKTDRFTVKLNFNVFAIVFYEDRKKKAKSFWKTIKIIPYAHKVAIYLVSRSTVYIRDLTLSTSVKQNSIVGLFSSIPIKILTSYFTNKAKKTVYYPSHDLLDKESIDESPQYTLTVRFPFYVLINSALIFTYYIVKNKLKRKEQYVRNE